MLHKQVDFIGVISALLTNAGYTIPIRLRVLLTYRAPFAVADNITSLKMIEYGFDKSRIAMVTPLLVCISQSRPLLYMQLHTIEICSLFSYSRKYLYLTSKYKSINEVCIFFSVLGVLM